MSLLSARHITKRYANHTALNDVSIEIPKGSIFGLLGPNGAGKTSLIRIITQITAPDKGEVLFAGEKLSPAHIKRIGYLPEERGLYKKMKVGEQLQYLAQLKGMTKREATDKLKQWFIKFDIKEWWNKNVEDLSKGMQQKVQFIATVLHEPELLILDEPFTGFDPVNANLIKDEIIQMKQNGCTIIFSTHRMESVEEMCNYIALIHQSQKILDGATKQIRRQYRTNTYVLEGEGSLGTLPPEFQLLDLQQLEENHIKASIKISNEASPNDLLQILIPQIQIHSFIENIPSMNDIFIRSVTGTGTTIEPSAITV
ncbi:ABC transporter ATP-binding protein [Xanthocytophaga agilis]|uniref:ABC transporter ATP-binding protein n=1 Tax=Xanthocytophaga agilis TaxID=3048010 RepID=A0AAE3QZX6_9BACT|nr:ABC transporter ATP-binding protein [Xanthocytophaga agilis]MDJ1499062.1 ABC transporter ATP-binding protein [Xanthocytophaga agilis]